MGRNEAVKEAIKNGIWKKDEAENKNATVKNTVANTTKTVDKTKTTDTAKETTINTTSIDNTPKATTPATITTTPSTSTAATTTRSTYSSPNYNFRGERDKTKFPKFVEICKLNQKLLKIYLEVQLMDLGYEEIISGDGYLYAKGDIPVLLTAHMDTVHKEDVQYFFEFYEEEKKRHIISSPQGIGGDDRCGIYMILEIAKTHKCSILFCEDEEIGGVGSRKFCKEKEFEDLKELKYMIELDRKGSNDAVFYSCDSKEFTKFIEDNTGYKTAHGSFSDISNLAPEAKVAAVNLSCGYYNAHTISEYVVVEEMLNTIEVVKKLLDVECEQFEYVAKTYGGYYGSRHSGYRGNWYDDYYEDYYGGYYGGRYGSGYSGDRYGNYGNSGNSGSSQKSSYNYGNSSIDKFNYRTFYIYVYNEDSTEFKIFASNAKSVNEALGKFFIANPDMCYNDVYDYEDAGSFVISDGWFGYMK